MENRQQFITELARVIGYQVEAEALLDEIQFPRGLRPIWQNFPNPTLYWTNVVTAVENGRLKGQRLERLAQAAYDQFPGNRIFREAAEDEPPPLPAATVNVTTPRDRAGPQPIEQWPTLVLQGTDQYGAFLRLVRETVGPAELLYTTGEQAAVLVRGIDADGVDPAQVVARLQRAVDQFELPDDAQATVRFETFAYRPHLIEQLTLIGPDQQIFYVDNIPNTTPVRDIPQALFAVYREEAVVDRVRPAQTAGGEAQRERLAPDQSLEESGVTERDELHVLQESTAEFALDQLRLRALNRVRNQIEGFAVNSTCGFRIVNKDDPHLPLVYEVEFNAPGFGPPEDLTVEPAGLRPPERDVHRATIILTPEFPFKAPWVVFGSPIFHPDVLPERRGPNPAGWVRIGVLAEESYRPDLDFYELCQLVIDIAAYRNYGSIQHGLWDEQGHLNTAAARWAQSDQGQKQILARGGWPIRSVLAVAVVSPSGDVRIRRADEKR